MFIVRCKRQGLRSVRRNVWWFHIRGAYTILRTTLHMRCILRCILPDQSWRSMTSCGRYAHPALNLCEQRLSIFFFIFRFVGHSVSPIVTFLPMHCVLRFACWQWSSSFISCIWLPSRTRVPGRETVQRNSVWSGSGTSSLSGSRLVYFVRSIYGFVESRSSDTRSMDNESS